MYYIYYVLYIYLYILAKWKFCKVTVFNDDLFDFWLLKTFIREMKKKIYLLLHEIVGDLASCDCGGTCSGVYPINLTKGAN